eukprot:8177806-Lingulodinium_polyedra.AAC.1
MHNLQLLTLARRPYSMTLLNGTPNTKRCVAPPHHKLCDLTLIARPPKGAAPNASQKRNCE